MSTNENRFSSEVFHDDISSSLSTCSTSSVSSSISPLSIRINTIDIVNRVPPKRGSNRTKSIEQVYASTNSSTRTTFTPLYRNMSDPLKKMMNGGVGAQKNVSHHSSNHFHPNLHGRGTSNATNMDMTSHATQHQPQHLHPLLIQQNQQQDTDGNLSKQELNGLNIAGVAVTLLTTIFTLFHPMFIVHTTMMMSSSSSSVSNVVTTSEEDKAEVIAAALIPEHNQQELLFGDHGSVSNNSSVFHTAEQDYQTQQATLHKLFVFCIFNPTMILLLSWFIDHWSKKSNRSRTDLISTAGCLFSFACFLPFILPLLSPKDTSGNIWSISLYDISYSITTIILASAVTDCHNMTTRARIAFMFSSEVMYLLVSVTTCQFGLPHFYVNEVGSTTQNVRAKTNETSDGALDDDAGDIDSGPQGKSGSMAGFCTFLIMMVLIACTLFVLAQALVTNASSLSASSKGFGKQHSSQQHFHDDYDLESDDDTVTQLERASAPPTTSSSSTSTVTIRAFLLKVHHYMPNISEDLEWTKRILFDFWKNKNFRIWIGAEILLKAQNSFMSYFLYLLMGRLVAGQATQIFHHHLASTTTFSNFGAIFLISISKQLATIIAYVPISIFGYRRAYQYLFDIAFGFSIIGLLIGDPTSDIWIVGYVFIYTTMTRATQSASIYLVMSDLVLEMKHKHQVLEHRGENEPSVAALFLGFNAFFAKPTRVIFAILAETISNRLLQSASSSLLGDDIAPFATDESKRTLYRILLTVTLTCSLVQMIAWNKYDLYPRRVAKIRDEMKHSRDQLGRSGRHVGSTHNNATILNATGSTAAAAPGAATTAELQAIFRNSRF